MQVNKSVFNFPRKLIENNLFFFGLLFVLFVWHFFTLSISPLPWFDEVFFAQMSLNLKQGLGLKLNWFLNPAMNQKEVLLYGPVYFWIQAAVIKWAGFSIFFFRLLNFLSGIGIVYLGFSISKNYSAGKLNSRIFCLLLSLDTIFLQNMHSGRMDLFGILLFLAGLRMLLAERRSAVSILLQAFCFSAAYLVTPRIGVYIVGLWPLAYNLFIHKGKYLLHYSILLLLTVVPILAWIFFKFGSLQAYFQMFKSIEGDVRYLGFNLFPRKFEIPSLLVLVFFIGAGIVKKKFSLIKLVFLSLIFMHLLCIKEVGPYSAMFMPFLYLLIVGLYKELSGLIYKMAIVSLLVYNLSIFTFKSVVLMADYSNRTSGKLQNIISGMVPKGKTVLADFRFFYFLKNCHYLNWEQNRECLLAKSCLLDHVDYILFSPDDYSFAGKQGYLKNFKQVESYSTAPNGVYRYLEKAGVTISSNYNFVLLKKSGP